jgi:hypothetical protein
MNDSDCRASEGYYCRKTFQLSATRTRTFTNGFCTPINCAATTGTRTCPTGYTCRRTMSGTTVVGNCIPSA